MGARPLPFFRRAGRRRLLEALHARGLGALRAILGIVLDRLAVLEGLEPLPLDDGMVNKDVLAPVVGSDEPETLLVIEPLDFPGGHESHSFPRERETCGGVDACARGVLEFGYGDDDDDGQRRTSTTRGTNDSAR